MKDFDLAGFLDAADGQYVATLKGQPVRFEVEAPGHIALIESSSASYDIGQKIEKSEPGDVPYTFEEARPLYRYADQHILRIEGRDWRAYDDALRVRLLRRLSSTDFWGLVGAITDCATLEDVKKNDSETTSS